jgi:hypothetical protein
MWRAAPAPSRRRQARFRRSGRPGASVGPRLVYRGDTGQAPLSAPAHDYGEAVSGRTGPGENLGPRSFRDAACRSGSRSGRWRIGRGHGVSARQVHRQQSARDWWSLERTEEAGTVTVSRFVHGDERLLLLPGRASNLGNRIVHRIGGVRGRRGFQCRLPVRMFTPTWAEQDRKRP